MTAIRLEPFGEVHLAPFGRLVDDPDVQRFTRVPVPPPPDFPIGTLRLELLLSVDNDASKRVALRCGYVREGVLRSPHPKPGVRSDMEMWSRLRGDP